MPAEMLSEMPRDAHKALCASDRHLVLNFDINKTVLMSDAISGKTIDSVVNAELACSAWGEVANGQWLLAVEELTARCPASVRGRPDLGPQSLSSYADWVELSYPNKADKKVRASLLGTFSHEGQPGASLSPMAKKLRACLKLPNGEDAVLVPSFLLLLATLKRAERSFSLVFRTFGEDMRIVAEDLCRFCKGLHPLFPDVRMDGSDGGPDYRLYLTEPEQCGTFHRDLSTGMSLVMGTLEQPGEGQYRDAADTSIAFYHSMPGVRIITGIDNVHKFLSERTSRCCTTGLHDYHKYWRQCEMSSDGGKVFFFEVSRHSNRHEVFFDDNIRYGDFYIVNPISIFEPERKHWVISLLQTHLCRAEPVEAMLDLRYFIHQVARLEAAYERKLRVRERLRGLLWRAAESNGLAEVLETAPEEGREAYDPWEGYRLSDSDISLRREDLAERRGPAVVRVTGESRRGTGSFPHGHYQLSRLGEIDESETGGAAHEDPAKGVLAAEEAAAASPEAEGGPRPACCMRLSAALARIYPKGDAKADVE